MTSLTTLLDQFQKEHDRLIVKYPAHLKFGGNGSFSIASKSPPCKLFITKSGDYHFEVTQVPENTLVEQFYSIEGLLAFVVRFFMEKKIVTKNPNSIKFILNTLT